VFYGPPFVDHCV